MSNFKLCRFCKTASHTDKLVKYGVRHYAHFDCFLDAGHRLDELHPWQVGRFPYRALIERGLAAEAERIAADNGITSGTVEAESGAR